MSFVWIVCTLIALLPAVIETYFQGQFYSRSGVCVPIHLTAARPAGWEYSVALFHAFNLSVLLFMAAAYAFMYRVIKQTIKTGT